MDEKEERRVSVSYTHLDVYKRQVKYHASLHGTLRWLTIQIDRPKELITRDHLLRHR